MHRLVFPANPVESLVFALQAREQGRACYGASLLTADPWLSEAFEAVFALPHLSDETFWTRFEALVAEMGVAEVISPHPVVFRHLKERYGQRLNVQFLEGIVSQRLLLQLSTQQASHWLAGQLPAHWPVPLRQALPDAQILGRLLFHALQIGGQSDAEKLLSFAALMASAVPGDVVEIGVFRGRSLWMLAALARHYGVGPVLGVDPWFQQSYDQNSPLVDFVQPALVPPADKEQLACAALWPDFAGLLNLIKAPSVLAESRYAGREISHSVFGQTTYSGQISVLHIDGNHAYEAVCADMAAWFPHLAPGAWIIFDDYIWRFGDGPQRAADAWLQQHASQLAAAFVIGETLFVRLQQP